MGQREAVSSMKDVVFGSQGEAFLSWPSFSERNRFQIHLRTWKTITLNMRIECLTVVKIYTTRLSFLTVSGSDKSCGLFFASKMHFVQGCINCYLRLDLVMEMLGENPHYSDFDGFISSTLSVRKVMKYWKFPLYLCPLKFHQSYHRTLERVSFNRPTCFAENLLDSSIPELMKQNKTKKEHFISEKDYYNHTFQYIVIWSDLVFPWRALWTVVITLIL